MTYEIEPKMIPQDNLSDLLSNARKAIEYDNAKNFLIASVGSKNEKYILFVCLNSSNELQESFFVSNDAIIFEGYSTR